MDSGQIYIAISIIALFALALGYFFVVKREKSQKMSKLSKFAFTFILAGIVFGEDKFTGYSLIGFGMIFAVIDLARDLKNNKKKEV